jgi:hypothetical protein
MWPGNFQSLWKAVKIANDVNLNCGFNKIKPKRIQKKIQYSYIVGCPPVSDLQGLMKSLLWWQT